MSNAGPEVIDGGEAVGRSRSELREPRLEQHQPLLRTKLFIPAVRSKRVARTALVERINRGLDGPLVLVSAPAGFGKTTLLAEWAAQAALPVAWLSLDGGDNDPGRFLGYLIAALNAALAGRETPIGAGTQALLRSVQPMPLQAILVALLNELAEVSTPFVLVLDDYQLITAQAVNEAVAFILERLPPCLHLVIATRADPALPLHRLRARGQLVEIRTDDLRFAMPETAAFLNTVMELSLSEADISTLEARTEGWIAGLHMAALSMQGLSDRPAFVQAFGGSHRYILEYLIEEVLDRQPEHLQAFLLNTSILDRLCGPLCEALFEGSQVGMLESSQGEKAPIPSNLTFKPSNLITCQQILEHLERANLFLTSLDSVGCWYRYHHLFADLLRARLQRAHPGRLPRLHLRASRWYEDAGLPEQAIRHALAAGELERAAGLVERFAVDILSRGEMSSLLRLFAALPGGLVLGRPALGVLYAWALTFSGQFEAVEPVLQEVERQIKPGETAPEAKEILGSLAIIRGLVADYRGDMASAIALARRADELLPAGKWAERSLIPFVLGDGYTATGELDQAQQAFEQIRKMGQASGNIWTVSVALHKLALLKKLQGRLRSAEGLYREAIQYAGERGGRQYGSLGATYAGLSDLLREWNELEAARQMALQAIENMKTWPNPTDLVNAYVTLARISLSEGEIESAESALQKAADAGSQGNIFPIIRKTLETCRVRLWLAAGDHAHIDSLLDNLLAAVAPVDENGAAAHRQLDFAGELEAITLARVLIARNDLERALNMLSTLAGASEAAGRYGRLIEILVLTALALHGAGRTAQALDVLKKSLALAEPEGYLRIFLDEGRPVQALLQACSRNLEGALKAYIDKLLAAFEAPAGGPPGVSAAPNRPEPLVEPLTGREVEVLHLLAAGLSNREIAARLVLSEGTVKTHTHNLFGKLGVQSRTRALARAKELDLI